MSISTTAGSAFYIGTTAAAANLTAFKADTYVELKEIEDVGEFGDEANAAEFTAINVDAGNARTIRAKGARDAGVLTITCARDPLDAGQRAMIAAEKDNDDDYNFKVVASDAPSGGTPSTFFFKGRVMSAKVNFSGADDVTRITFQVAINTEILEEVAGD